MNGLALLLLLALLAWAAVPYVKKKGSDRRARQAKCPHGNWSYLNAYDDPRWPARNCGHCGLQEHLETPVPCPHCGEDIRTPPGKDRPVKFAV